MSTIAQKAAQITIRYGEAGMILRTWEDVGALRYSVDTETGLLEVSDRDGILLVIQADSLFDIVCTPVPAQPQNTAPVSADSGWPSTQGTQYTVVADSSIVLGHVADRLSPE
jgi:hypothetical protein